MSEWGDRSMEKSENRPGTNATEERREFLKKAGQVAAAAPAIAVLLSAAAKPASANGIGYIQD
jgi:hypothetical protein